MKDAAALLDDPVRRHAIGEEVADVMAFLLSFANATGIDMRGPPFAL